MKRLIAIFAACCVALALIVVATGSGDDGSYRVRAIFNNAAFVIPGMDVKIAGVRVGVDQHARRAAELRRNHGFDSRQSDQPDHPSPQLQGEPELHGHRHHHDRGVGEGDERKVGARPSHQPLQRHERKFDLHLNLSKVGQ